MDNETEQNATESDYIEASPLDQKLALLLIENPASTDQELAIKLGIGRQAVNRRKNSPVVQKTLRAMFMISEREMRRLTVKGLDRLEAFLDHEDPKIRLTATLALLKLNSRFMENNMHIGIWE